MDGVNEILNEVRKHLVLPVDFKAQERIEKLAYVILGIGAVTSFGIGLLPNLCRTCSCVLEGFCCNTYSNSATVLLLQEKPIEMGTA